MPFKMEVIVLLTLFAIFACSLVTGNPCPTVTRSPGQPEMIADPGDCAAFFICMGAVGVRVSCAYGNGPAGSVFDPNTKTCVKPGSQFDHSTCNGQQPGVSGPVMSCLKNNTARFPDTDNCARYFRCEPGLQQPAHIECPYPRLYSLATECCEIYLQVQCAGRWEPKDPCDYEANQCHGPGCAPCNARFASCKSLPDGPNLWKGRRWTPHYVICRGERVELQGDCRHDGQVDLFNPYTRLCMSVTQILDLASGPVAQITGQPIGTKGRSGRG